MDDGKKQDETRGLQDPIFSAQYSENIILALALIIADN